VIFEILYKYIHRTGGKDQKKESGGSHFRKKENFYGLVQHMFKPVMACSEHVHFEKII
jgi:hypothetical protein